VRVDPAPPIAQCTFFFQTHKYILSFAFHILRRFYKSPYLICVSDFIYRGPRRFEFRLFFLITFLGDLSFGPSTYLNDSAGAALFLSSSSPRVSSSLPYMRKRAQLSGLPLLHCLRSPVPGRHLTRRFESAASYYPKNGRCRREQPLLGRRRSLTSFFLRAKLLSRKSDSANCPKALSDVG